ncbi:hypothetical protein TGME49_262715 [Toxoplasma gondii ME49]|uniref:Uncharacterized protein n=2 Tax=Toxoplasma gondii TaxID=5811 RepID=S8GM94_TOXGM|nr:hypothetical protein TGME49_262715 [Toxoplasma gondii ME49]EPT29664.1 hypothetical protein TGME49_262715 [Toxoplasma gondii ME49]KYF40688.1 hypothetical protein TGARI_262715 [Toxoplasma gondii ARI]|eukprot:XP_018637131.1 hypothetical protein TGME49_262715 [Toxoplasma gondii ME49]
MAVSRLLTRLVEPTRPVCGRRFLHFPLHAKRNEFPTCRTHDAGGVYTPHIQPGRLTLCRCFGGSSNAKRAARSLAFSLRKSGKCGFTDTQDSNRGRRDTCEAGRDGQKRRSACAYGCLSTGSFPLRRDTLFGLLGSLATETRE